MIRRPPASPPFPYTTLFRSADTPLLKVRARGILGCFCLRLYVVPVPRSSRDRVSIDLRRFPLLLKRQSFQVVNEFRQARQPFAQPTVVGRITNPHVPRPAGTKKLAGRNQNSFCLKQLSSEDNAGKAQLVD